MEQPKQTRIAIKKINKMKNIIIIFLLVISSTSQCQDSNIITEVAFNNIKINNHKLSVIKDTNGAKTAIESLFGGSVFVIDPDGDFYNYSFNGFNIGFSSIISNATHNNPIISKFEITNSNWSMTINGVTIKVGDNISLLGNVIFNTNIGGSKSILYMYCDGCNSFIGIDFNQITKTITKIYFIELT
jgi:hypothetical protein